MQITAGYSKGGIKMALPKTKARLQSSITIYTVPEGVAQDSADSLIASLKSMKKVGAIKSLKVDQSRTINVWRELDAEKINPGEIVEAYPSLPKYTLTIEKTVLYKENLLQAFGMIHGLDLLEQSAPLLIVVQLRSPDETNIPVKTVFYTHVWFQANPLEFDIENDDLRITQSVTATVGRVITHPTA
jgi:hypothetical protein